MEPIPWVGDLQVDHRHLGVVGVEVEVKDINKGLPLKSNLHHQVLFFTQHFLAQILAPDLNSRDLCLI